MNWRFAFVVSLILAIALAMPSALGGEGIVIWGVSEPHMNPDPVESGGTGEVSFEVTVWNRENFRGCREVLVTGMYGFPVCAYLLQWTISLDGPWFTEGSTPIGTGFAPYVRTMQEDGTRISFDVRERVHLHDVEPGEHTLHVQVNWVAGVPVSQWTSTDTFDRALPCGLTSQIGILECAYRGAGWVAAPTTTVEVTPASQLSLLK